MNNLFGSEFMDFLVYNNIVNESDDSNTEVGSCWYEEDTSEDEDDEYDSLFDDDETEGDEDYDF